MKSIEKLSIPEQVILHNHFKPLDIVAKDLFKVDSITLEKIKNLSNENFRPDTVSIDPIKYESIFIDASSKVQAPRTATRYKRPRGRPGLNIVRAFSSIPTKPVPAEIFAKNHNISISVLRQHKRFDKTNMGGQVFVRKDMKTNRVMVWRRNDES